MTSAQDHVHTVPVGGTSAEQASHIVSDDSNYVYVTGYYNGTVDFDHGAGTASLTCMGGGCGYLAKYTSSGDYVWALNMATTGAPVEPYQLAIAESGAIYVTGYLLGSCDFDPTAGTDILTTTGAHDAFIAKYDTAGNYIWAKSYGGSSPDWPYAITLDTEENIYISGTFIGTSDFDPGTGVNSLTGSGGSPDIFYSKYDSSGSHIWAKNVGGSIYDEGFHTAVNSFDQLYGTGYYQMTSDFDPNAGTFDLTSEGAEDMFLTRLDTNGNLVWAISAGGTGSETGLDFDFDNHGNIYVVGTFDATFDIDSSTAVNNMTAQGSEDIFVAVYDTSGQYLRAFSIGGTGEDVAESIKIEGGYMYITGHFNSSSIDFDPGAGTSMLSTSGSEDIFMAKYDTLGNLIWAESIGGADIDKSYSIDIEDNHSLYIAGSFESTVDFDPSATSSPETSAGSRDIFIAKYMFCGHSADTTTMSICNGETYLFEGSSYNTAGMYSVELQSVLGCDSTRVLDLTVLPLDTSVTINSVIELEANGSGTYQWIDCNTGTAISGETNATFTATANGSYAVVVTNGVCSDTSSCYDITGVGINELPTTISKIYPNPSNGVFFIESKINTSIEVRDVSGRVVYRKDLLSGNNTLDLNVLEAGRYFIQPEIGKSLGIIIVK